jgi:hypothetical protein
MSRTTKVPLPASVTRCDNRWVAPRIPILMRYGEPPVGQSFLAVARKPVEKT